MHSRVTPNPFGVPGGVSVTRSILGRRIGKVRSRTLSVCLYNLLDGVAKRMTQGEVWEVRFDFSKVAVIANVVTNSIVFQIFVILRKV